MTLPARCCALAPADIDPYLPPAPQLQQASRYVAVDRRDDRPTDGRTDGRRSVTQTLTAGSGRRQ